MSKVVNSVILAVIKKIISGSISLYNKITSNTSKNGDSEFIEKIARYVMSFDEVIGIHDIYISSMCVGKPVITFHAEVNANGDFVKLHDTIDNIEKKLSEVLSCHVVIHMDPISLNDEASFRMKRFTTLVTKSVNESLNIKNFRMVYGPTHINLIFDVEAPKELSGSFNTIKSDIEKKIKSLPGNLSAVIDIETAE